MERAAIEALRNALQDAKRELQHQTDDNNLPRGLSPKEERLFRVWDERLTSAQKVPDAQAATTIELLLADAPTLAATTLDALAATLLAQLQQLVEPDAIP